ncbi:TPA: hypothetical protein HA318_04960 [Candidatus Micrarchaeota archaeon]|nr:MAG: hypothetical protein AUJ65_01640 [Candidatus Micrarchaeota archaeon CG1_02_51_15]HII39322.1 hypothetical protein [Candidatus Micrarchaeota archaeon]
MEKHAMHYADGKRIYVKHKKTISDVKLPTIYAKLPGSIYHFDLGLIASPSQREYLKLTLPFIASKGLDAETALQRAQCGRWFSQEITRTPCPAPSLRKISYRAGRARPAQA